MAFSISCTRACSSARSTARCCTRRSSWARARSTARCARCRQPISPSCAWARSRFVNELYGDETGKRRARAKARFVNNAMMATLLGAAISDALADGQVVSGVGGQYNFVAQSFALEDARSIIMLRATRTARRRTSSNVLWNYGHTTIPRHLRDIVVTEYGIADLRGKSDRDVIAAMLAVADSRFQDELLRRARCRQDRA